MKKIKSIFILFFLIVLLSGCYNSEATLTINSNKSINLNAKIFVNDYFDEMPYLSNLSVYENRNINVKRINESNIKGYSIIKNYQNIDKVSTELESVVDITKYMESGFNDKELFKVEKGEYTNKYSANFIIDKDFIKNNIDNMNKKELESYLSIIKDIYNKAVVLFNNSKSEITYSSEKNELNIDNNIKYSITIDKNTSVNSLEVGSDTFNYKSNKTKLLESDILLDNIKLINNNANNYIFKFIVKLPSKSLSNNATTVSGSGETLTWVFDLNGVNNKIEFSFELENTISRISSYAVIILLPLSCIILISIALKIKNNKRKKIEKQPIYKGYDKEYFKSIIKKDEVEDKKEEPIVNIEAPINVYPKTNEENTKENYELEKTAIIEINDDIENN